MKKQNWSETWTFFDGDWHSGNFPLLGPRSHAFWQGSSVFDGGRAFEGVTPDIDRHCARVNNSARTLGLEPTMKPDEIIGLVHDGLKKFESKSAVYIRPMYWAEVDGFMGVPPDPTSTRFLLTMYAEPMEEPTGTTLTVSSFRRPTIETMPTNAKAGCLYPNNARMILEAQRKGFTNALALDLLGNVAETALSNVFMVKDGVVMTPIPTGAFLNGITRQRVIKLLRDAGVSVEERSLTVADFRAADEIFTTGNYSKVTPIIGLDDRKLAPGPIYRRARKLYWEFAHS